MQTPVSGARTIWRTRDNRDSHDSKARTIGESPLDTVIRGVMAFFSLFGLITRRDLEFPRLPIFPAARLYPYTKRRGAEKIAISDFYVHLRLST